MDNCEAVIPIAFRIRGSRTGRGAAGVVFFVPSLGGSVGRDSERAEGGRVAVDDGIGGATATDAGRVAGVVLVVVLTGGFAFTGAALVREGAAAIAGRLEGGGGGLRAGKRTMLGKPNMLVVVICPFARIVLWSSSEVVF